MYTFMVTQTLKIWCKLQILVFKYLWVNNNQPLSNYTGSLQISFGIARTPSCWLSWLPVLSCVQITWKESGITFMCLIWMLLVVARKPKICLIVSFRRTSDGLLVSSASVNIVDLELGFPHYFFIMSVYCIFCFCGILGNFLCNICELNMKPALV